MNTDLTTHRDRMSPLKGAAASIMLVLLMERGRAFTSKELEYICDYSDKPVAKALTYLQAKYGVQYNGHYNGYCLPMNMQLPLPVEQIAAGVAQLDAGANRTAQLGAAGRVAQPDANEKGLAGSPDVGIFPRGDRNYSDLRSSSSYTYTNINHKDQEEEEEEETPPSGRNISDIYRLLVEAGVGSRSKTLSELLQLDLETHYVAAHIEARKHALEQGDHYPVSWLITKLRDGDPAPAPPRNPLRQHIPDDLRDIIKR